MLKTLESITMGFPTCQRYSGASQDYVNSFHEKHCLAKQLECIEIYSMRSKGKIVILRKSPIENIVL